MSQLPRILPQSASSKKKNAPPTNNVEQFTQRECVAYIAQLKGLLEEATAEPPAGVNTAEVERRMAMLQNALSAVEEHYAELQKKKEDEKNQRYLDNIERRIQLENEEEEKRVYKEKERRGQVREMREHQLSYYQSRNQALDEKAAKCRDFNENAQVETITKAGANEERRKRNVEHLMEERKRQVKELHDREEARQEYARRVNRKREQQMEEERQQLAETTRLREQEIESKLEEMREAKRTKWVAKKQASSAKSRVVWENGEAILETETKDHERLVQELDEKVKQQQQRYAAEQAERQYELNMRMRARQERQERQHKNMLEIIDRRVAQGDTIVKESHEKIRRGDETKEKQANQYSEKGAQLRKDIALHLRRAASIEKASQNNALDKNYRRWNDKAARVLADLRDAMAAAEDQKNSSESQRLPNANSSRMDRSTTPIAPSSKVARLPSPSDFAV